MSADIERVQRLQAALKDALVPLIGDSVVAISFAAIILHPDGKTGAVRGNLALTPEAQMLATKLLHAIATGNTAPPELSHAGMIDLPQKN